MDKIRITAVSYLNTKPFIYGLFKSNLADRIELSLDIPSVCARKLAEGAADLALSPVAIIPEIPECYVISDYCIGALNDVRTVCIYSDVPLEQIDTILLDFHSRTSAALTRILVKEYWKINPKFQQAAEGYEEQIIGRTAGLVIGDRAVAQEGKHIYTYDLGRAWHEWTGLPFVFAAWLSAKPLDPGFVEEFNNALSAGLAHIPELIKILPSMPHFDVAEYFARNISYEFDARKWEALGRYLNYLEPGCLNRVHRVVGMPTN